jgi:hypothetical protein
MIVVEILIALGLLTAGVVLGVACFKFGKFFGKKSR